MKRLSYANITATLALVLAMGGTSIAASHYLITSTSQIKPSVIHALRGPRGAQGPKGEEGKAPNVVGLQGLVGPPGPQGKEGPLGPTGTAAPYVAISEIETVQGKKVVVPPSKAGTATVLCPSSRLAISGGGDGNGLPITADQRYYGPEGLNESGWEITVSNSSGVPIEIKAEVTCATRNEAMAG